MTDIPARLAALREPAPAHLAPEILARAGLADRYATRPSPLGPVFVAFTSRGVSLVDLAGDAAVFEAAYRARFGREVAPAEALPPRLAAAVDRALAEGRTRGVPVDPTGLSEFQAAVLHLAAAIPAGEVRPYGWVAREIGRPGSDRAVGNALAANPVPLVVPCHRVVRADGRFGRYSLGADANKRSAAPSRGPGGRGVRGPGRKRRALPGQRHHPHLLPPHLPSCPAHHRRAPGGVPRRSRRNPGRLSPVPGLPADGGVSATTASTTRSSHPVNQQAPRLAALVLPAVALPDRPGRDRGRRRLRRIRRNQRGRTHRGRRVDLHPGRCRHHRAGAVFDPARDDHHFGPDLDPLCRHHDPGLAFHHSPDRDRFVPGRGRSLMRGQHCRWVLLPPGQRVGGDLRVPLRPRRRRPPRLTEPGARVLPGQQPQGDPPPPRHPVGRRATRSGGGPGDADPGPRGPLRRHGDLVGGAALRRPGSDDGPLRQPAGQCHPGLLRPGGPQRHRHRLRRHHRHPAGPPVRVRRTGEQPGEPVHGAGPEPDLRADLPGGGARPGGGPPPRLLHARSRSGRPWMPRCTPRALRSAWTRRRWEPSGTASNCGTRPDGGAPTSASGVTWSSRLLPAPEARPGCTPSRCSSMGPRPSPPRSR